MVDFLLGMVIGGLSLWLYMRERALRLEAQIDAVQHKRHAETAKTSVKTRTVGEGASSKVAAPTTKKAKPEAEAAEPEELDEPEESHADEESDASEESDAQEELEAADAEEAKPEKKKPAISLKLPESSSVSEAGERSEE